MLRRLHQSTSMELDDPFVWCWPPGLTLGVLSAFEGKVQVRLAPLLDRIRMAALLSLLANQVAPEVQGLAAQRA